MTEQHHFLDYINKKYNFSLTINDIKLSDISAKANIIQIKKTLLEIILIPSFQKNTSNEKFWIARSINLLFSILPTLYYIQNKLNQPFRLEHIYQINNLENFFDIVFKDNLPENIKSLRSSFLIYLPEFEPKNKNNTALINQYNYLYSIIQYPP